MVKKINKITKELSKELKGFEDIFEEYVENEEDKERRRSNQDFIKNAESYELQNFLEEETARLSNVELFFTKKIPAKINFPQTERLIVEQMKRKEIIKEKLIFEFVKSENQLQKNLAALFNAHFS